MIDTSQKKAESTVCNCIYHTSCLIQRVSDASRFGYNAICGCGAVLLQQPYSIGGYATPPPETVQTNLAELRQQATFRADLKALRKRWADWNKAKVAARKAVVAGAVAWKQQYGGEIEALKTSKKESIKTLQQGETLRLYHKTQGAARKANTVFKQKYQLTRPHLSALRIPGLTRRHWRDRIEYLLARRFDLGL